MKIAVVGTRGIPGILGGVETHCQELYPRIAAYGHDVTIIRRSSYVKPDNRITEYRGVRLKDVFAPRRKSIEAIVHTLLAVIRARRLNPDVLHIHAIGPSLMVPLARALGMKVVVTNHGHDYNRGKWGRMAKTALRTGERLGTRHANGVIAISDAIADRLRELYGRTDTFVIPNGVTPPKLPTAANYPLSLGLEPRRYVMTAGRFVPEKNFHQLIEAFADSETAEKGYRLVIAGAADHPDSYSRSLKELAKRHGVVLTGFISGEPLWQLLGQTALFVLPSSHEGLPISLLEAMSFRADVLASDIVPNQLPELADSDFFPVGDIAAMRTAIDRKLSAPAAPRTYDMGRYDWDSIASETIEAYLRVLGRL